LAQRTSHPAWILRALRQALTAGGRDGADIESVLQANNVPASVTLVARPGRLTREELALEVGSGAQPGRFAPTALILPPGSHQSPAGLASVRSGAAGVQDEGSQLVALALAEAPLDGPDAAWLDLCAGPGGKAAMLAGIGRQRGAGLTAVELHPHRADLVRRVVGDEVTVEVTDGRDIGGIRPGVYDRVLVDVPCTGLGALRRRPEARWRHTPADLTSLGPLQRALLTSALAATRPGGIVAYATCSPHLAETTLVIRDVLRRSPNAGLIDAASVPSLAAIGAVRPDGTCQLWTDRDGTDALYLALIAR
jgi:16S rRNA (cytosine967-C5)-methyltransferase